MAWSDLAWLGGFWGAGFGIGIVFVGYPMFLVLAALTVQRKKDEQSLCQNESPFVSMLVVFRNAGPLLDDKIANFLHLDYPEEKLELVLISDGSRDQSKGIASAAENDRIRFYHFDSHLGKSDCLNSGIALCRGEIVILSDVDAMVDSCAVKRLANHFFLPQIGGVCGQRVVSENKETMGDGQKRFIQWDSMIKMLEVRIGMSVTSHDGKLYAIRKELFFPVPQGVTDDAYLSLSIVRQGFTFTFDPMAKAFIRLPSRDPGHELRRRKRIVSTSLRGLWLNRCLFNIRRYGIFAPGLFFNKVLRRLVPIFLIVFLISSFELGASPFYRVIALLQVLAYGMALIHPIAVVLPETRWNKRLKRASGLAQFFCVGMAGTLWGVISFLSGEKITKWEPEKK